MKTQAEKDETKVKAEMRKHYLKDLKYWVKFHDFEVSQAEFFFRHRDSWTAGGQMTPEEGYADARSRFYRHKANVKYYKKLITKYTCKLMATYSEACIHNPTGGC